MMFHKGHQISIYICYADPWCDQHTSSLGWKCPSSSRQATHVVRPLDFMMELVLHNFFPWVFWSYMMKFDISLWASLLNTNNSAIFSLHHLNQPIWNEKISKQTLTFGIHFAITSKICVRKICQLALTMFIYIICKDCNFQCRLWVTPKWFKSNNIIIKELSWTLFLWLCCNSLEIATLVAKISGKSNEMNN
jgi:hypothetical protein